MLKLIKSTDPRLRTPSKEVTRFDGQLKEFVRELNILMTKKAGIGIAASQAGKNIKLFIIGIPLDNTSSGATVMINAEINGTSGIQLSDEGCLSHPKLFVTIPRPEMLDVSWQDLEGRKHRKVLKGLPATVFQHEYDHCAGCTIKELQEVKEMYG